MEGPHRLSPPWVNAHSHRPAQSPEELAVLNVRLGYEAIPEELPANTLISIGIHPWDIGRDWKNVMVSRPTGPSPNHDPAAIGECGFDRLRGPEMATQHAVFEAHVHLAEEMYLPLIVHCAKAFEDLQQALKRLRPAVPVIVHGFDKHPQLAQELLRAGCYLSFGKALLKPGSSAAKSLVIIPEDRFLFETDDADTDIREVYAAAAALRGREISEIRSRVWHTWTQLSAISPP